MFFVFLPYKRILFMFLNFFTKITLPLSSHLLHFFVKDLTTRTTLLQGKAKPIFLSQLSPIIVLSSTKSSPTIRHHRLRDPSSSIYKYIVSTFVLEFSESSNFNFYLNSYQCNKSHKLPFYTSSLVSHSLYKLFSRMFGPRISTLLMDVNTILQSVYGFIHSNKNPMFVTFFVRFKALV